MSFNDSLRDTDEMLYQGRYDKNKPSGEAAWKALNFTLAAAPKAGVTLAHTWTKEQEWNASKEANGEKVKTATKLGFKNGSAKFDVSAANDKWSAKVSGPLVTDDWKVNGSALVEQKPAAKDWKAEATANIASPNLSGNRINANITAEFNKQNEIKVNADAQINIENDWSIGAQVEHLTSDVKDAKVGLKEASGHIVKKDTDGRYWLGYSHHDNFVKLGCLQKYSGKNFEHAYEARYSLKEGDTGFYGFPVHVAAGGKYTLSNQSSVSYGVELSQQFAAAAKYDHKIDEHWRLKISQLYDNNRPSTGKRPQYDLGFDVTYTL